MGCGSGKYFVEPPQKVTFHTASTIDEATE